MSKSVFVTATGTDIGKTYISGLLVKKMRDLSYNCGYYKPVLSGAVRRSDGSLIPGDCADVIETSALDLDPSDCVSYCFDEALSPHLAAKRRGVKIDKNIIKSDFIRLSQKYDYMVVEGAGGIACPFNLDGETLLLSEIINVLGLDIIIVADAGLGTINSALLTFEYAKSHSINVCGFIINNYDENDFMHADNKIQIERLTGVKVLAAVGKNAEDLNMDENGLLKIFIEREA